LNSYRGETQQCQRSYTHLANFISHMRIQRGKKSFSCYPWQTEWDVLWRHIRIWIWSLMYLIGSFLLAGFTYFRRHCNWLCFVYVQWYDCFLFTQRSHQQPAVRWSAMTLLALSVWRQKVCQRGTSNLVTSNRKYV